jgi:hypothetical protein
MDSRSRLNDGLARAPESLSADREERLLRFVDILRAEQVRASIEANAKGGRTGARRWRGLAPFLVIVVIAIGVAAALLKAPGLSFVGPDATRDSAAGTASVQAPVPPPSSQSALPPEIAHSRAPEGVPDADAPAGGPANLNPTSPVAGVLSSSNARPPGSAPAKQGAADSPNLTGPTAPPATVVARPDTIEPLAPGHDADAIAAPPPPVSAEPEVSELETGKPILLVYYPHRSRRGEATARNLAARIGSEVTSSDIEAPASLPDNAMIKFSDERNHKLARMIGKSLGDLGYRWRIEKVPSLVESHRNMIEVWLPMK